jgi:hypothetical protein
VGNSNSKPHGPIIMMGQSKTRTSTQIIFITLFLQVHSAAEPRTRHGNVRNYAEPKPFSRVKPVKVGFSSSIFTVQDHILSTAGDALRSPLVKLCGQNASHHHTFFSLFFKRMLALRSPLFNICTWCLLLLGD